jgi:hypothetical protein
MFDVIDGVDQMWNLLMQAFNPLANGFGIARKRDDQNIAERGANTAAAPAEGCEL